MKITTLKAENFRGIRCLELKLSSPLTVLSGINGVGKSTLLDALALMLSWAVARIRRSDAPGHEISHRLDIHNEASYARLSVSLADEQAEYTWAMVRVRRGRKDPEYTSDYRQLNDYTKRLRETIDTSQEQCNIPLFVYYSINRAVLDIPLQVRQKSFSLLDAYEGALTSTANFRTFFKWFRSQEDLENENRKYLDDSIKPENFEYPDRQLETVRRALSKFLPEYKDFSVRRSPLRMVVMKKNKELRIEQLSDGEKCLIAMIGDIARRLAIANPVGDDPLLGEGVVLIDEIDLHLHPTWQRMVPNKLNEVFPNCQFVLSTHSPQVIGEIPPEAIRRLSLDEEQGITFTLPQQTLGLTSNDILDEIMRSMDGPETLARNLDIEKKLQTLFAVIDEENFTQARRLIQELRNIQNGDTPDLIRAEGLMAMLENGADKS